MRCKTKQNERVACPAERPRFLYIVRVLVAPRFGGEFPVELCRSEIRQMIVRCSRLRLSEQNPAYGGQLHKLYMSIVKNHTVRRCGTVWSTYVGKFRNSVESLLFRLFVVFTLAFFFFLLEEFSAGLGD